MFMGEYNHTIDTKGRLIIPSKFREELGEEFVVTKGLDGCLFVFPEHEWNTFEEKLKSLPLPVKLVFLPTVNYMRLLILPPGRRHLSAMLCGATKGEAAVSCWSILRRKSPKSTVRAYPDFVL